MPAGGRDAPGTECHCTIQSLLMCLHLQESSPMWEGGPPATPGMLSKFTGWGGGRQSPQPLSSVRHTCTGAHVPTHTGSHICTPSLLDTFLAAFTATCQCEWASRCPGGPSHFCSLRPPDRPSVTHAWPPVACKRFLRWLCISSEVSDLGL